jgi:hypothetical protein
LSTNLPKEVLIKLKSIIISIIKTVIPTAKGKRRRKGKKEEETGRKKKR